MMRSPVAFALLIAALVLTAACSQNPPPLRLTPVEPRPATDVIKSSYVAADSLIAQVRANLPPDCLLIAATLVNINRLDESTPLGRLITEQIAGRFTQNGFRMIEVKLRNQIYMKRNEGELILTREVRDIAKQHQVRAIIAGTYTTSADRIFVNLKLIDLESNVVIGAFDYYLERDTLIRSLMNASS
jgi:TolB-like protein